MFPRDWGVTPYVLSRRRPIRRVLTPFREFVHSESSGGILLLAATIVALVWANSPWSASYDDLWHQELTIRLGAYELSTSLAHWINDGLMVIFFFVVGLEIKRELLAGELASVRHAILPALVALGGAVTPALIYLAFNYGSEGAVGWGVPMATDIAFALGAIALLGNRISTGLKVFLTAIAIVDDIIAVVVIALFYTVEVLWLSLLVGAGILVLLTLVNWVGVTRALVYGLLGIGLWIAFLNSGVHATIAGVLLAMTIPARTRINAEEYLSRAETILDEFRQGCGPGTSVLSNPAQQAALQDLETATEHVHSPLQRFERALHPWVAYAIVPLFALANAGVTLEGGLVDTLMSMVTIGIVAGLVVGKQLGVTLATWLTVRIGLSELPSNARWGQVYGVGWLAGIGFTMALFIANLAFSDPEHLAMAKIGILVASVIAGVGGWIILRVVPGTGNGDGS